MMKLKFAILVNWLKFRNMATNSLLECKVFCDFLYPLLEVVEFIPTVVQIWIDIGIVVSKIDGPLVYQNGKKSVSLSNVPI